jgi:hypothetical protein
MDPKKYNRARHLELAKRSKEFKNLGKSFFREEKENYLELLDYQGSIGASNTSFESFESGFNLLAAWDRTSLSENS